MAFVCDIPKHIIEALAFEERTMGRPVTLVGWHEYGGCITIIYDVSPSHCYDDKYMFARRAVIYSTESQADGQMPKAGIIVSSDIRAKKNGE